MKKITAVLIGAGQRGMDCYAPYALKYPDELKFIAVAEPNKNRREAFCKLHDIPIENAFSSYDELLSKGKIADATLICTQDNMHYESVIKAISVGYDILLEKPMSNNLEESYKISKHTHKYDKSIIICHVLRYTPFFMELKRILDQKIIGEVVTVQHNENVGYWHQAHSYVRGNWRDTKTSSPMILAKSCHDMDILYWLLDSKCVSLSSYGGLAYFKKENAPDGAPDRCLEGCSSETFCPYSAKKIYLSTNESPQFKVLRSVVSKESTGESITKALKTGPYGRCVFKCDNDAVDHQTVNMIFENQVTAVFTMSGFTKECSRTIKIMGTHGEIRGHMDKSEILIDHFNTCNTITIKVNASGEGHGGGDEGLMRDFVKYVRDKALNNRLSFAKESYHSHLMAFASEYSRRTNETVNLTEFEKAMTKNTL